VKVLRELTADFVAVRNRTLVAHPGIDCASDNEITEEMQFFSDVLQCYDICFALLRGTRTIFTAEEIEELEAAIRDPGSKNQRQLLPKVTTYGLKSFHN
jgi:hypothetical protein